MKAYNIALVLVRFLGVYFLATGFMGLAYIAFSVGFFASGGARWLVDPALYFASQGVFGNPIYLISGVIVLWKSVPIARFIAKYCEGD